MVSVFGSVRVQVSLQGQLVRWKWQESDSYELFYHSFEKIVAVSHDHNATQWLADISTMPPIGISEQLWLSETWLAQFALLGVKQLAVIEPRNLHNQLAIESVLADGRRHTSTDVQFFPDVASALDWLTWADECAMHTLEQEWQNAFR